MKHNELFIRQWSDFDVFDDFITRLGGDMESLIDASGVKKEYRVESWNARCLLLELATQKLNEPYIGLKWAFDMPQDYSASGPTLFLGYIASDLRHFFDLAIEYQKYHTNGVAYSYETDLDMEETIGVISIHPSSIPCRQLTEHIIAGMAIMGRRYITDFNIKRVSFQHKAPMDLYWYEKAFQCPIEFNARRNTLVFDNVILGLEKPKYVSKLLRPFLQIYLNKQVNRKYKKNEQSIALSIAAILPSLFGARQTELSNVAKALNMHEKKLQRLLKDDGTTYSEILVDVRKNLARRYLLESEMPIHYISNMLDYSSAEAFNTAFKRWFGKAPSRYRQAGQLAGLTKP